MKEPASADREIIHSLSPSQNICRGLSADRWLRSIPLAAELDLADYVGL